MENGEVEMNECMENEIMQQDLEMLVDSDLPITALEGKSVLVTGATGLIGSQMVYLLACYNRMRNLQIHIIAMVRNEEKGKKMFSHLIGRVQNILCLILLKQFIRHWMERQIS